MRTVIVLVAVAALGGLFLFQKQKENQKAATTPPVVTTVKQTAASPRPVSEHNWMKRSLDRANDVKRQVAEQRKQNGTH